MAARVTLSQNDRTADFLERNERWYRKTALSDKYSVPGENASAPKGTSSKDEPRAVTLSQNDRTADFLEGNERWYRKTALSDKYSVPGENASAQKGTSFKQPAARRRHVRYVDFF